jgi:hypothetical protein
VKTVFIVFKRGDLTEKTVFTGVQGQDEISKKISEVTQEAIVC